MVATAHEAEPEALSWGGLLWAAGAAAAGAFVWAWIMSEFDAEVGWIAWGVGALVGASYRYCGGRGQRGAIVCGALALAGVAGGKYLGARWILGDGKERLRASIVSSFDGDLAFWRATYAFARAWGDREGTDEEIRKFLADTSTAKLAEAVERSEYGILGSLGSRGRTEIDDARVVEFRESIPTLEDIAKCESFDAYREREIARGFDDPDVREVLEMSPWRPIGESLGLLDVGFTLLGMATAFGLATGSVRLTGEEPYRRGSRSRRAAADAGETDAAPRPPGAQAQAPTPRARRRRP